MNSANAASSDGTFLVKDFENLFDASAINLKFSSMHHLRMILFDNFQPRG